MITFTKEEVIRLANDLGYALNTEGPDSELEVIMLGEMGDHIEQIRAWME